VVNCASVVGVVKERDFLFDKRHATPAVLQPLAIVSVNEDVLKLFRHVFFGQLAFEDTLGVVMRHGPEVGVRGGRVHNP
jgi:hypothetical protein